MPRPPINQPRDLWKVDGSFRDAYVLGTALHDWNAFFVVVRLEEHQFFLDAVEHRLLEPEDIFHEAERCSVLLTISLGQVQINCHFFSVEEIELDIDPEQIEGDMEHEAVLKFLERIACATCKTVQITEESVPTLIHLDFDPSSAQWRVYEYPAEGEA